MKDLLSVLVQLHYSMCIEVYIIINVLDVISTLRVNNTHTWGLLLPLLSL